MLSEVDIKSMRSQRRVLGILCILLAPCSFLFGLIGAKYNEPYWYTSISDTYYANSKILMIGLLFSTAVYFLSYKGYDKKDRICSLVEAISAFGIITFPNGNTQLRNVTGLFCLPNNVSNVIHDISAGTLFITFGVNIFFLFTLGDVNNPKKRQRNIIYRVCGIMIFLGVIAQMIYGFVYNNYLSYTTPPSAFTMINEFIMLIAFGFSYLVKSEAIAKLNDNIELA